MAATTRNVKIKVKSRGSGSLLEDLGVEPMGVRVKGAGLDEEVLWKKDGRISSYTITFDYTEGSPFAWTTKTSDANGDVVGESTVSGNPRAFYRYRLSVQIPASGIWPARTIEIDPEVVIDDGTPPPDQEGGQS